MLRACPIRPRTVLDIQAKLHGPLHTVLQRLCERLCFSGRGHAWPGPRPQGRSIRAGDRGKFDIRLGEVRRIRMLWYPTDTDQY